MRSIVTTPLSLLRSPLGRSLANVWLAGQLRQFRPRLRSRLAEREPSVGVDASKVDARASTSERTRPGAGSQPPNAAVSEDGTAQGPGSAVASTRTALPPLTAVPARTFPGRSPPKSAVTDLTVRSTCRMRLLKRRA